MQILVGNKDNPSTTLTWQQVMELARAAATSAQKGSFSSGSVLPPQPPPTQTTPPPQQPGQSLLGPEDLNKIKLMPQPDTFYNHPASENFRQRYMAGARRSDNVVWSDDKENNPPAIDNMAAITNHMKLLQGIATGRASNKGKAPQPTIAPAPSAEESFFMDVPPMAPSLEERPPMFQQSGQILYTAPHKDFQPSPFPPVKVPAPRR